MNWEAVSALGQIAGAVAVVASILHLTKQTRVSAEATISASRSTSAVAISEIDREIARDPDLARIVFKSMQSDLADFDDLEWFRFTTFARCLIYLYEDQYMQSLMGTTEPEIALRHVAAVIGFSQLPAWRKFWDLETRGDTFRPEFVNAVNAGRTPARVSGDVIAGRT